MIDQQSGHEGGRPARRTEKLAVLHSLPAHCASQRPHTELRTPEAPAAGESRKYGPAPRPGEPAGQATPPVQAIEDLRLPLPRMSFGQTPPPGAHWAASLHPGDTPPIHPPSAPAGGLPYLTRWTTRLPQGLGSGADVGTEAEAEAEVGDGGGGGGGGGGGETLFPSVLKSSGLERSFQTMQCS